MAGEDVVGIGVEGENGTTRVGTSASVGVGDGSTMGVVRSMSGMDVGVGWSAMFCGGRSEGEDGFSRVQEIAANAKSATDAHRTKRFILQAPCQGTVPPGCDYYINIRGAGSQGNVHEKASH